MNRPILRAEKRKIVGRKVKVLRKQGVLPANIYGKRIKSQEIQVDVKEFLKLFKEVGETGLVELQIDKEKKPVLIHNVQFDPVDEIPLHADFLQVDLKEKVIAKVPLELIGESPAEKEGLGTVVQYINELEVEALPGDLPDKFEIDASKLSKVDQIFLARDIVVDKKEIKLKTDPEQILVKVEPPKKEEEVPPPKVPSESEVTTTEARENEGEIDQKKEQQES